MTAEQSPSAQNTTRALVLGGGGPVGRAWHMGLAAGMLDLGVDLREADRIVGTSAGAVVGARLALGLDPRDFDPAIDGAPMPTLTPAAQQGLATMMAAMVRAATSATPERERARIGAVALAAPTPGEAESLARAPFASLQGRDWPPSFIATSVDAQTGMFRAWRAADGVALLHAVAASAALPHAWPPITLDGRRYMDGGVRSMLNADLAAGCGRVIVVSCFDLGVDDHTPEAFRALNALLVNEIAGLRDAGAQVDVIGPSPALIALSDGGARMLDTSLVPQAFQLGKAEAQARIHRLKALWSVAPPQPSPPTGG